MKQSWGGFAVAVLVAVFVAQWAVAEPENLEYREVDGKLTDEDFYRLVGCAALPGEPCWKPWIRWTAEKARDLTIGITLVGDMFPGDVAAFDVALDHAIAEVNGLDAGVRLRRDGADPDIAVMLMPIEDDQILRGTGVAEVDGAYTEGAYVRIWWDANQFLQKGVIVMTPLIFAEDAKSVMLEEMVQSLGFLTDIQGPPYEGTSIFSQTDNETEILQGQDQMVIRRHYPR